MSGMLSLLNWPVRDGAYGRPLCCVGNQDWNVHATGWGNHYLAAATIIIIYCHVELFILVMNSG